MEPYESPDNIPYTCSPCNTTFQTIGGLHKHLECHIIDRSYHYNHSTRTAYLLNTCTTCETQTDPCSSQEATTITDNTQTHSYFPFQGEATVEYLPVKQELSDIVPVYDAGADNGGSEPGMTACYESHGNEQEGVAGELVIKHEVVYVDEDHSESQPLDHELFTDFDYLPSQESTESEADEIFCSNKRKKQKSKNVKKCKQPLKKRGRPPKSALVKKELPADNHNESVIEVLSVPTCNICSETFCSWKDASEHVYQIHEDCTFRCCVCWQVFMSEGLLDEHLTSHKMTLISSQKQKQRGRCGPSAKGYTSSSTYRFHKKAKHKPTQRAKCNICDLDFSNTSTLNKHKIEQHFTKLTSHYCAPCKRQFAYKYHYVKHMIGVHKDMSFVTQTFICEKCGFRAFDISRLNEHKQSCLKEHLLTCTKCDYSTYRKKNLRVHMMVHSEERNHMCHYCGMTFRKRAVMLTHQRIHTGEKPFKCSICGSCFAFESPFKRHQDMHNDIKAHKCTYCGKEFHQKSNCQAHMRQHTGEKPFKCDYCGQGFTHNVSRKNHMTKCPHMHDPVNLTVKT